MKSTQDKAFFLESSQKVSLVPLQIVSLNMCNSFHVLPLNDDSINRF